MGAQDRHTSFVSELAATSGASTGPPVSTLQAFVAQLAAVHGEPHPEVCVCSVCLYRVGSHLSVRVSLATMLLTFAGFYAFLLVLFCVL